MAIKKYKFGTVQMKKDKSGTTVAVGNPYAKADKYKTFVEITIKDHEGNVLAKAENGFLQVVDPRKNPNATEEQIARIPEFIKNELYLVVDDGQ